MFKSGKMKRTQSKVKESHVLKAKGRELFKKGGSPLHLKSDARSGEMRTKNVSLPSWQYESHSGDMNNVITEDC